MFRNSEINIDQVITPFRLTKSILNKKNGDIFYCPPPKRVSEGGHRNTGVRPCVRPSHITTLWTQLL